MRDVRLDGPVVVVQPRGSGSPTFVTLAGMGVALGLFPALFLVVVVVVALI